MNTTAIIALGALLIWGMCGLMHLSVFWLDGIYKEASRESTSFYQHWVVVPKMPISWLKIILTCLLHGPLARKAMKSKFGIEHSYFEED